MKIGIDLGTTNSAFAFIDPREAEGSDFPPVHILHIPQQVLGGQTGALRSLPSFLFLDGDGLIGENAREQGALVPTKLVHSAKSWMSNPEVDRTAKILPWDAQELGRVVSPVEASARYIAHMRDAWEATGRGPIAEHDVVLTVPASFDEEARELTVQAARDAGIEKLTLLEEPAAAFYSWIANHLSQSQKALYDGMTVLVVDVGGGTSDFTVMRMRKDGFDPGDVLAIGGVSVAGDAFDACIMRNHVARHFGSEVSYRVPMGANVLTMPKALVEKLCSPADASLMRSQDAISFLRNVRDWSLGPDDRRVMDQLFTFVEDRLGFSVFESIELAKRELSGTDATVVRFSYPTVEVEEPITRAAFEASSAARTAAIIRELDATLARAGLQASDVELVCCTGGTARLPAVADALAARFGRHKLTEHAHFHSVVHGLAEHARAVVRGEA